MKVPSRSRESFFEMVSQVRAEREAARQVIDRLTVEELTGVWDSEIPLKWCTAGFVEELVIRADAVRATSAKYSLLMAQVALTIANRISGERYPRPVQSRLGGIAWYEIGNAHYSDHAYGAALVAYEAAQKSFAHESALTHEEATAKFARAAVYTLIGDADRADFLLTAISGIFSRVGDRKRQMLGELLLGVTQLLRGDVDTGRATLTQIRRSFGDSSSGIGESLEHRIVRACLDWLAHDDAATLENIAKLVNEGLSLGTGEEAEASRALANAIIDQQIDELLRLPIDDAESRIRRDSELQTSELTKRLVDNAEFQTNFDPPLALKMATLAVVAAECLSESRHSSETCAFLRGSAYRQKGIALYYAARYPEALESYDRADSAFEGSAAATYEKGRVAISRTVAYSALDRKEEATASALRSQSAFSIFWDPRRFSFGRFAEAYALSKFGEWKQALIIFQEIRRDVMDIIRVDEQARIQMNIAQCHFYLGEHEAAAREAYVAAALFAQAGTKSEVLRMHWWLAVVAREQGKIAEAVRRFDEVAVEFIELGMVGEAASVRLDTAETLLAIGDHERAAELCRAALEQYQASGMAQTKRALMALGYLTDAVRSSKATVQLVKHVKEYLQRLPSEPTLLFAPPPEPPDKGD